MLWFIFIFFWFLLFVVGSVCRFLCVLISWIVLPANYFVNEACASKRTCLKFSLTSGRYWLHLFQSFWFQILQTVNQSARNIRTFICLHLHSLVAYSTVNTQNSIFFSLLLQKYNNNTKNRLLLHYIWIHDDGIKDSCCLHYGEITRYWDWTCYSWIIVSITSFYCIWH